MECKHCGHNYDYGHSGSPYDHYCKACFDYQMEKSMQEFVKKYDPAEKRDFVTQKEVDTAIEDLQRIAADLA